MSFDQIIQRHSALVHKQTKIFLEDLEKYLRVTELDEVRDVRRLLEDFVLSGKLIRGSLYLILAKMYGHKNIDSLRDIAVAIEINHSGLLIHDDVMDNDSLRRGKPSMHMRYKSRAQNLHIKDADTYGNNMAICIGDICFFVSSLLIERSPLPYEIKKRVVEYYFLQIIKTGLGQMSDVKFGLSEKDPSITDIQRIYQYKTATYTFNAPFVMGYLSCNKNNVHEIEMLEKLGCSLGIIFQITDDLIGFTQKSETIGKDAGSDVRENKKTLVRNLMLKKLKKDELDFAHWCFGNKRLTNQELVKLREIFFKEKINEIIKEYIEKESANAKRIIVQLSISKEYKAQLADVIPYITRLIK